MSGQTDRNYAELQEQAIPAHPSPKLSPFWGMRLYSWMSVSAVSSWISASWISVRAACVVPGHRAEIQLLE